MIRAAILLLALAIMGMAQAPAAPKPDVAHVVAGDRGPVTIYYTERPHETCMKFLHVVPGSLDFQFKACSVYWLNTIVVPFDDACALTHELLHFVTGNWHGTEKNSTCDGSARTGKG